MTKNVGEFDLDFSGQFLLENSIESYYIFGNRYFDDPEEGTQSHAWLQVSNLIVQEISLRIDLLNYNKKVFVGIEDKFHDLFQVEKRNVHISSGLNGYSGMSVLRLLGLYKIYLNISNKNLLAIFYEILIAICIFGS